jgi:hypothetical protein
MGYTTKFSGSLDLSRKLTLAEARDWMEIYDTDRNMPLPGAPNGRLQWVPTDDLEGLVWDGNEKFYEYIPWLTYLCEFLKARGITVSGQMNWAGEDPDDTGVITVVDSRVSATNNKSKPRKYRNPLTPGALAAMALKELK